MREKSYSAYVEIIHSPLVVFNPLLYPEPVETHAFYSHLNLLPTLAEPAGVPELKSYGPATASFRCCAISRPACGTLCCSPMTTCLLSAGAPGANLRALREGDWTYAVYFGLDGSGIE